MPTAPDFRLTAACWLAREPWKGLALRWYDRTSRRWVARVSSRDGVRAARSATEDIFGCVPAVSDLDFVYLLRKDATVDQLRALGREYAGERRLSPILGDVVAFPPRLEELVRKRRATALFFLDWPRPVVLDPWAGFGLANHFLRQAWRRWVLLSHPDCVHELFHERVIVRSCRKGLAALGIDEKPRTSLEGLGRLGIELARYGEREFLPPSGPSLALPQPDGGAVVVWDAQFQAWCRSVPVFSRPPDGACPGVAACDEPLDAPFWERYRHALSRANDWQRELAPCPLPASAAMASRLGWSGCERSRYATTRMDGAVLSARGKLPEDWGRHAGASYVDRLLTRLSFALGTLCRGRSCTLEDRDEERGALDRLLGLPVRSRAADTGSWPASAVVEWADELVEAIEKL